MTEKFEVTDMISALENIVVEVLYEANTEHAISDELRPYLLAGARHLDQAIDQLRIAEEKLG